METLGHLLHSVGETVGLVSKEEKKDEVEQKDEKGYVPFSTASASEGAAPAATSEAYPEWQKKQQKEGGILSSLANAARAALVPPPLDADPVAETVEPIKLPTETAAPTEKKAEEAKEEKQGTFLGNLLHKVEEKIENALPMVAQHGTEDKDVRVSALGPVWEKDEEEPASETGKLEAAEETHGPSADKRDAAMEPLKARSPTERKAIGDWEAEGGSVRKEEAKKEEPIVEKKERKPKSIAQREDIGVSEGSLQRVAKAADRVMAANAEERRTSISPAPEEKKDEFPERELKVATEAKPAEERIKDKEVELPRGAEEKAEAETAGETAPAAPKPAVKQISVNTLIKLVAEPIAKIDESKLPPLTAEIAFAGPASMHEPTHREYHPKHTHGARRTEHPLNQPRHQA